MFEARVCGIPCQIEVTRFYPGDPGRYSGPIELCYPEEAPEVEFELYDRKGYRARWLEEKLTSTDEDAIVETCLEHLRDFDD